MALTYSAWLVEVTQLAESLYGAGPDLLRELELERCAGYEAGDSPGECVAGLLGGDDD
jgi:hypothetical protein